ncbi:hypothetical protein [Actimicrobium antarcticum]|uniref:hypothetical protein n=1 Tax=Actimicrobium antarcticum TaxID=1051899 RepID=UPI0031D48CA7
MKIHDKLIQSVEMKANWTCIAGSRGNQRFQTKPDAARQPVTFFRQEILGVLRSVNLLPGIQAVFVDLEKSARSYIVNLLIGF